MNTILVIGIIWTLYGVAGLFGLQKIPTKFKAKTWTKRYIHYQGIAWILLGIPWIVLALVTMNKELGFFIMLPLLLVCTVPGFIYAIVLDRRYTAKIKQEK